MAWQKSSSEVVLRTDFGPWAVSGGTVASIDKRPNGAVPDEVARVPGRPAKDGPLRPQGRRPAVPRRRPGRPRPWPLHRPGGRADVVSRLRRVMASRTGPPTEHWGPDRDLPTPARVPNARSAADRLHTPKSISVNARAWLGRARLSLPTQKGDVQPARRYCRSARRMSSETVMPSRAARRVVSSRSCTRWDVSVGVIERVL